MSASPVVASPPAEAVLLRRARLRLLAWSGGATLALLLGLGAAIWLAVSNALAATGEEQLRERAAILQLAPVPGTGRDPTTIELAADPAVPGVVFGGPASGTLAMILGPADRLRVDRGAWQPGEAVTPLPSGTSGGAIGIAVRVPALDAAAVEAAVRGETTVSTATLDGTPVRVLTTALERDGGPWIVQVIGDRTAEVRTLDALLAVLLVGGVAALALALGAGWLYAGRALVPVRESMRRQREFAADASHELRTPLTVLRNGIELLRRRPDATIRDSAAGLDALEAETGRVARLVDDLLLLARSDSGAQEVRSDPVDLAQAAAEAVEGLEASAASANVRLALDVEPAPMRGDHERLRQLVAILVDNAIRHGGPGDVHVRAATDDGGAVLTVSDSGPGIEPGREADVFRRFWRGPGAAEGGSGLGLAIAAWIADRHGGTIGAANAPGRGATFTVRLPSA